MEVSILLTEKEILNLPNDGDLGKYVRKKYLEIKEDLERSMDVEYDHCVICGKQSPYTKSTHIDERIGYIEGGGQGCFSPNKCDKI
jgi:hypothetical protein